MKKKEPSNKEIAKTLSEIKRQLDRLELSVSQPEVVEEIKARAKRQQDGAIMRLAEEL